MKNQGVCRYCLKTYSGSGMGRHLTACSARMEEINQQKREIKSKKSIYHLKIWGWRPMWLHIEMNSTLTLRRLDQFLRNIWLECCDHLSQFKIKDIRYVVEVGDPGLYWGERPRTMNYQLKKVLRLKETFEYEYDFGSTTYLEGQVISERPGKLKEGLKIMARNKPPVYSCNICNHTATDICVECYDDFCETCFQNHECSDERSLPIINSPRVGVCGYTGYYNNDTFMDRFDS